MLENKKYFNLVDFLVLFLGSMPIIFFEIEPFLADHFRLSWLIGIGLFMYACIGFPVGAVFYLYWRIKHLNND